MAIPAPKPRHRRRVPKRGNRGEFNKYTRRMIFERDEGKCRQCGIYPAHHIHHVKLKSSGGRGVFSNGMLVCFKCHNKIHRDNSLLKYWQEVFRKQYGDGFYKDEWDKWTS